MKRYSYLIALLMLPLMASCELITPDEVKNPNVVETDFIQSPHAMRSWVNGSNARLAVALTSFSEYLGLLSDDLFNNSSRSSKTWDRLEVYFTDGEISALSTRIGEMIEMAGFGLNTLAPQDEEATPAQCFNLSYIQTLAYLMAGENFVALPKSANGKVLTSDQLIEEALRSASLMHQYATTSEDSALVDLLQARAYRVQGNLTAAAQSAQAALHAAPELLRQVQFDELNGVANTVQGYVATELFTIHPRLAAQQAKFPQEEYSNQPMAFAKAEEAWLILAEEAVAGGRLVEAAAHLNALLTLVAKREASVSIVGQTPADIEAAGTQQALMAVVYRLRQEVFFGEGRRASDLGFRLPLSEVEFCQQGNLPESYTKVVIPAYISALQTPLDEVDDLNISLVETL